MVAVVLIFFPLLASLALAFIKNNSTAKKVALAFSLLECGITGYMFSLLSRPNVSELLSFSMPWIYSMGINFNVVIDGISGLLVLLTNILVPLIILSSFKAEYKNPNAFYSLILFMQMALVGVFVAQDGFLFYIFWELALIPIYFICLLWGGNDRARITFKFFVYTLVGSLFMLVALILLYQNTGPLYSFNINALYKAGQSLSTKAQSFVFLSFFLAFAIKMPVFPFHTWQPDTYTTAPTQGTMLLSGIMLKMGTYGLIRWLIPIVPLGVAQWGQTAIVISIIGIVYASCIAIVQKDLKRLIAYSSIAHVGLIAAGTLAFNTQGVEGALIQMFSHGVNVTALFFIVDIIALRTGTREIPSLGGIRNSAPVFSVLFLIVLMGSIALPLTNGFVGEFLLLNGIYQYSAWLAFTAGLSVILGAVYMLRCYQNTMLGETNNLTSAFADVDRTEKAVLIPLVILVIYFGIYPKPLLEIIEPAVQNLINSVHLTVIP
ncbi:MAG: NADH-quinone oxidoreductase subunit M [Bacteroidia bacterium]|nr:NADH-quinone oxidoreductase subunit M [Bacteroidia bacterium]